MMDSQALMVAKDIVKTYVRKDEGAVEVLKKTALDIYPGDSIAIVGKSGSGKSTFLHILGTLESPTSGSLFFLGQNLLQFPQARLALFRNRELGFVFQFHYLMLEFNALENVMMPGLIGDLGKKEAEKRASHLLERVGLQHRMKHRPSELSGGEQQRVAIARALMMRPKLLLTDEMTGNLDPVTGAEVFSLIREMHAEYKMAMVSVTHDEELAMQYDRQYRLVDGKLVPGLSGTWTDRVNR